MVVAFGTLDSLLHVTRLARHTADASPTLSAGFWTPSSVTSAVARHDIDIRHSLRYTLRGSDDVEERVFLRPLEAPGAECVGVPRGPESAVAIAALRSLQEVLRTWSPFRWKN